ncbi:MAG: hypothetical protein PHE24_06965 [Patescibacteria group bacterium]|nr:hypothetical protein [Patescibacteria group bacterium]
MSKIKTMIPAIILFLAVLPVFAQAQDIDISDAPSHFTRGAALTNANAKYWLSWFNQYSVNIDSLSRHETGIALNQLYQIYRGGYRDSTVHLLENGVASAIANFLQRGTLVTDPTDRQFAIFTIIYVGFCDPVNTPASALLPILKNIELKNGDGHRDLFRVLGKKSDSLLIASLCDIIIHPENYPGKDTCIYEYVYWDDPAPKPRVKLTAIAAEF